MSRRLAALLGIGGLPIERVIICPKREGYMKGFKIDVVAIAPSISVDADRIKVSIQAELVAGHPKARRT
jgi:hypothetical protein